MATAIVKYKKNRQNAQKRGLNGVPRLSTLSKITPKYHHVRNVRNVGHGFSLILNYEEKLLSVFNQKCIRKKINQDSFLN